ncbi:MAG: hypothetical protein ABI151_11410 [Chitinophagaceae bacterium]
MNYNISAYIIYLLLISFIIILAGRYFYQNGRVFILALFKNDEVFTDKVNLIILVCYYLFNIGYAFLKIRYWTSITGYEILLASLGKNLGLLILILAITHYLNMAVIYYLSKSNLSLNTTKPFQ